MRLVQGGFAKETHIDALPISKRTREALRRMSVWYLEDLAEVTDAELRQQQGVGESTCELLIEMLKTVGLHLREAESFER
ncbi:MAG: hypothetical protein JSS14_14105 [Proteobacteria bacterium]|nr:hypothetical protein [Pseudomonadota bacterium]